MGVSLERVQYKFASIIGELCSEPVVLSQFAIWLDLRLAEYKSKGAISLDCSGEKPDPSWLKGLKTAAMAAVPMARRVLGSRLTHRSQGLTRGGMYSKTTTLNRRNLNSHSRVTNANQARQTLAQASEDASDRLDVGEEGSSEQIADSDDIVMIKDEPKEEIYPISLHIAHQESDSRKRTAETSEGDDPHSSTPFQKVRKLPSASSTPAASEPLNESLISVIGSAFEDDNQELPVSVEASGTDLDFSVNLQSQSNMSEQDSVNIQWGDNSAANFFMSAANSPSTSTYSQHRASASALVAGNSGHDSSQDGNVLWSRRSPCMAPDRGEPITASGIKHDDDTAVFTRPSCFQSAIAPSIPGHLSHYKSNTLRMSTFASTKKRSTVGNLIYAVRTFERWLSSKNSDDRRQIEEIPPDELDGYLAEFFSCVKNSGGKDYNSESFRILRANMDSYLKEKGYPHSISKSPAFGISQLVFNQRKQHLRLLETQTVSPQTFLSP